MLISIILHSMLGMESGLFASTTLDWCIPFFVLHILAMPRDANFWGSKMWRLSVFYPPPSLPLLLWKVRTLYQVLHQLYTIKMQYHRFDARNNLCQWLNRCKKMQKPYYDKEKCKFLVKNGLHVKLRHRKSTIFDKINEKPRPPSPSNQGWKNGAFLPFARLHPWFGGDGGLLFHFILSKIVSKVSKSRNSGHC